MAQWTSCFHSFRLGCSSWNYAMHKSIQLFPSYPIDHRYITRVLKLRLLIHPSLFKTTSRTALFNLQTSSHTFTFATWGSPTITQQTQGQVYWRFEVMHQAATSHLQVWQMPLLLHIWTFIYFPSVFFFFFEKPSILFVIFPPLGL